MIKCKKCGKVKEDTDFMGAYGKVVTICASCRKIKNEYMRKRNLEKKEYLKEKSKKYWEENRESLLKKQKERYANNPEPAKTASKKYREDHKYEIKEYMKKWRVDNYEKMKSYSDLYREANRESAKKRRKIWSMSPAKYETYHEKLTSFESPILGENEKMMVKCAKCRKYFYPTNLQVVHRVSSINQVSATESRIYCSKECKLSCEVYRKVKDPADKVEPVERDKSWVRKVKQRANYACEMCGSKKRVEAHHIIPVKKDSKKASLLDNGVCLCFKCHRKVHSMEGCSFVEIKNSNTV